MHIKHVAIIPAISLALMGAGCLPGPEPIPRVETPVDEDARSVSVSVGPSGVEISDIDGGTPSEPTYDYVGSLEDVTGGDAAGSAMAAYGDGMYVLEAVFQGLPEPEGTDFYEGWIVRRGVDQSVLSTGRVNLAGETAINLFDSKEDLTDHDFYVLTLEPDDGDPAPAEHVLEGVLLRVGE